MCSSTNQDSFYYDMSISTEKNYYFTGVSNGTPTFLTDLGYLNETISGETFVGCENIIYAYTRDTKYVESKSDSVLVDDYNNINVNLGKNKELKAETLLNKLDITGTFKIYNSSGQFISDFNSKLGTGSKIVINDTYEYIVIVNGDVSGDGVIKSNDALLISRHLIGLTQLGDIQRYAADVHKNGVIKSNDALLISQFLIGMRESL